MRKHFLPLIFVPVTVLAILISSCTPGSCFEETNAYVKSSFFKYSDRKPSPPDSLTLYGIGRDTSIIYGKVRNVSKALIPLDPSSENCGFVIRINGVNDTIYFTYSSTMHMISKDCGYTFFHKIEMPVFSKNIIDSVAVLKSTITTLSEENIRIYY